MKSAKAIALLLGMTLAAWVNLGAQDLPRLAVVEFSANNSAEKTKQDIITVRNLVESEMVASGKFEVISRNDIDKLLAEQKIAVNAITSAENVKKLQLLNISYIVTGSVDAMGTDYAVTVKVLDVSSGKFSHSANNFMAGGSRDLYNGVNTLVGKFVGGMSSQGGQVVQTGQGGGTGTYKVGGTGPGGGMVFNVEGKGGMEVSVSLGQHTWNEAINVARNYRGGEKSDWRLPSIGELKLIYVNLQKAGLVNFSADWYWSSSQYSTISAWLQHFGDGRQDITSKDNTASVRAVRAF
jgi:TolB-like protein